MSSYLFTLFSYFKICFQQPQFIQWLGLGGEYCTLTDLKFLQCAIASQLVSYKTDHYTLCHMHGFGKRVLLHDLHFTHWSLFNNSTSMNCAYSWQLHQFRFLWILSTIKIYKLSKCFTKIYIIWWHNKPVRGIAFYKYHIMHILYHINQLEEYIADEGSFLNWINSTFLFQNWGVNINT